MFCVGWNVEGKRLASGSVDQTVRVTRVDDSCGVSGAEPRRPRGSHRPARSRSPAPVRPAADTSPARPHRPPARWTPGEERG